VLSVVFAFASAMSSALTVVTQHVASRAAPPQVKGWRLGLYLVRSPLWLIGVLAIVGSFAFQALALYNGRMSVVQSILITELVFSLLIGRLWLRRPVRTAAWVSASTTAIGVAAFLIISEPDGGHPQATTGAWVPALLTLGVATAVCVALASSGSPVRRAAFYATATGIVLASMATFLKSTTETLADSSFLALFTHWQLYALVVTGALSVVLTQAALHYGPLVVSQPLMVIVARSSASCWASGSSANTSPAARRGSPPGSASSAWSSSA
jgi:drug/metabolite transporter (DMT)-like permease